MVENGRKWRKVVENGRKWISAGKWQEMDFRVFYVTVVEVTRKAMEGNGRKWSKMVENGFPRENGRKWISACFTSFPYYYYLTKFVLSNYPNLQRIEIGNNCFGSVETFQIDGLNRLKTIRIGNNSFTQNKNSNGNDPSKSFHILNCESLESIQIGFKSFSDFGGEFELKNIPQLQSIQIGTTIGNNSFNFYYSSFVIRGMN